jgi:DNA-binding NtrC family response regulator
METPSLSDQVKKMSSSASPENLAQQPDWQSLGRQARQYLTAGAWQSAHDLLWPHLEPLLCGPDYPSSAIECLCLALAACTRLNHYQHLASGVTWLRREETLIRSLPPEVNALASLSIAHHEMREGQLEAARSRLTELEQLDAVSSCTQTRILLLRGRLATSIGNESEAETMALQAAETADRAANDLLRGDAFTLLAILARKRGALDEANSLYGKAATTYWRCGNLRGQALVHLNRAWALGLIGMIPDSYALFEETLNHAFALRREETALRARLGMGWVAMRGGELAKSRAILLEVWREARRLGMKMEEGMALEYLTQCYILGNQLSRAGRALRLGRRVVAQIAPEGDLAVELGVRAATLNLAYGKFDSAIAGAAKIAAHAKRLGLRWEEAQARDVLGIAYARSGRRREAIGEFRKALENLKGIGERLELQVVEAWLTVLEETGSGQKHRGTNPAVRFWLNHPLLGPRDFDGAADEASDRVSVPAVSDHGIAADERTIHPIWTEVGFVTASESILNSLQQVETYAPGSLPILILGETGTGKDLIARGIHHLSESAGTLVPVNCAAARKDLFVAELFGARKGAYTGALEHRRGLIEEAEGGSLFFDEIADLELEAQGFLLRFLDSGEVRPLGSTRSRQITTRILAATCRNLSKLVQTGAFREDLYARLAGLVVHLTPLRERSNDSYHIAKALWQRGGGDELSFDRIFNPTVRAGIQAGRWPGNVRELKHLVDRTLLYNKRHGEEEARNSLLDWLSSQRHVERTSPVLDTAASVGTAQQSRPSEARRISGEWDESILRETLMIANGRISRAARILGISRSHAYRLYKRIKPLAD